MENAVDALKIGFAVLVFTMALSLTIYMFSQARETADIVLHSSDVTEYMQYQGFDDYAEAEDSKNRVVGLETVIPTLYKYYKENYTVIFRESDGEFLPIYTTLTDSNLWSEGYNNKYYGGTDKTICSFDVDEETRRHEPWTASQEDFKKNLDAFLSGGTFVSPSGNGMNYTYDSFIEKYSDDKFIETLGEYTYETNEGSSAYGELLLNKRKKRVIIYTLQ